VDRLQAEVGDTVELADVLLVSSSDGATVGTPIVGGAKVVAEVLEHGRDAKVLVFKYKNKTRYRRRHGHRQDFTRLAIRDILVGGKPAKATAEEEKPKRPARRRTPKPEEETAATPESGAGAAGSPGLEAEAGNAPRSRRRRATRATAESSAAQPQSPIADEASAPEDAPADEPATQPSEEE
jgi:large subunit ribosomal protein L21